jgi:hypothetical protein
VIPEKGTVRAPGTKKGIRAMPRHQFVHGTAVGRLVALSLLASACGAASPSPEINTVPAPLPRY